jgi:3-oxoacyl-[acyl-carrier protein] reductase
MTLKDKVVLITGGSKGIGRACVEAFAQQGANVVINYAHDKTAAEEVAQAASKHGVRPLIVQADVTKANEVEAMFQSIESEFGTLDILINNAGVAIRDNTLGGIRQVFETNLFGQIQVTNTARRLMKQGKVIFISSIHGQLGHGSPDVIGYSASKAALESYMKNLAKELAPDILVNAIAPGRTLTPAWGEMSNEAKTKRAAGHLINRWIEPSEIADGALFLAKNDAVCGEVLVIDGGMNLKVIGNA